MKHLLILLSILLLSSPVIGQSEESCYVSLESSEDFNSRLLLHVSISLISQYLKQVNQIPPEGISLDSCIYTVLVDKEDKTTFVTLSGNNLNSFGDSELSGIDGFKQSVLRSFYRSLKEKRNSICDDYGLILEECSNFKKAEHKIKRNQKIDLKNIRVLSYKIKKPKIFYIDYKKMISGNGLSWITEDNFRKNIGLTPNEISFIGNLKFGQPVGHGIMKSFYGDNNPSNFNFEGNFKNGDRNGFGILIFNDGRKIEGEWKGDKEWDTIEYDKNGKIVGKFVDGKYKFM